MCGAGKIIVFTLVILFSVLALIWMSISAAYLARDKRDEKVNK